MGIAVAVAAGFGVGLVLRHGVGPTQPFALYLTDAQMPLGKLDVDVGSVTVGNAATLDVVHGKFDLASLHGPQDAILVAQGNVPVGIDGPVKVHFNAVHATVGGVSYDVPNPADLVLGSISAVNGSAPAAALADVDLPNSLVQAADGFRFDPRPAQVLALEHAVAGERPNWTAAVHASLAQPVGRADAATQSSAAAADAAATEGPSSAAGAATQAGQDALHASDLVVNPTEAGVHDPVSASSTTQTGWLVQFENGTADPVRMQAVVDTSGGVFVQGMKSLPFAYVLANPMQAKLLGQDRHILHIEPEVAIHFDDAESKAAIRQPQVVDLVTGLKDHSGNPIDGRGIGVAVVDTGIDTLHPDLAGATNAVVIANYKVESDQVVPLADTDTSGHGTHVAAIVAGQGVQDPSVKGVAPGAKLYGLGITEGSTNVWAVQGFDWILQNYNSVTPPIRVVTNSWETGTTYDPNSAITQFVNAMVNHGLVVVFSAGNNGGDGSSTQTSAECQIPTPGVICVAGFDDQGTGTRDGKIGSYSSRGATSKPGTWPDLSAPGTSVLSAKPPAGIDTGANLNPYYIELTGTSQAAPHVAAVAAMMLQMRPSLTPAMVELDLKATAYKYADGGAYNLLGTHYAKGFGLLDAYNAVHLVT